MVYAVIPSIRHPEIPIWRHRDTCVYLCVCVSTYIYIYAFMHTQQNCYVSLFLSTYICIHTHTHVCAYMYTYSYTHTHTNVCTHAHTYLYTPDGSQNCAPPSNYAYVYPLTHTCTYTQTHTRTHTHTCMHTRTPTHTSIYTYPHAYMYAPHRSQNDVSPVPFEPVVRMYTHENTHIYISTYTYTHTHTPTRVYIHTHVYLDTHTHMPTTRIAKLRIASAPCPNSAHEPSMHCAVLVIFPPFLLSDIIYVHACMPWQKFRYMHARSNVWYTRLLIVRTGHPHIALYSWFFHRFVVWMYICTHMHIRDVHTHTPIQICDMQVRPKCAWSTHTPYYTRNKLLVFPAHTHNQKHIHTYIHVHAQTWILLLVAIKEQTLLDQIHCNTLQHTMQHCTAHCNTLQHTATYCNILQHIATHITAAGYYQWERPPSWQLPSVLVCVLLCVIVILPCVAAPSALLAMLAASFLAASISICWSMLQLCRSVLHRAVRCLPYTQPPSC